MLELSPVTMRWHLMAARRTLRRLLAPLVEARHVAPVAASHTMKAADPGDRNPGMWIRIREVPNMTDHRSQSGRAPGAPAGAPGGESAEATVRSLVQAYGTVPPYDRVEWNALAQRVVGDAQSELKRRLDRAAALSDAQAADRAEGISVPFGIVRGGGTRRRLCGADNRRSLRIKRRWFEVTADWVRPAMLAAAVVSGVAVTLTIAAPTSPGVMVYGDSAAALASASQSAYSDQDASDSAMEAAVVGRASDRQVDLQFGPSTRDAMFTAVVEER